MRTLSFFFTIGLLLTASTFGQNPGRLGDITRTGEKDQFTIEVESSDPGVKALATRAFQLHGAFRPVGGDADIRLQLRTSGDDTILFTATSGGGEYNGTVTGSDMQRATTLACDRIVENILDSPGFFSGTLALVGQSDDSKEIFVGDLFFQRMRQVTNNSRDSLTPNLSPDARKILYTTYSKSGFPDIYELDVASGQSKAFATYEGTNTGPAYSPDGSKVAMILSSSGNAELYVSGSDGRYPKRRTNNRSLEASPSWSPDGREIVLTSDAAGQPQLFRIAADGGNLRRIATNISKYCAEPDWNPRNPNQFVFTIAQGGGFQVALYDSETGLSKTLTEGSGDAVEPVWLNDGRHILYTRRNNGRLRLEILDTVTGTSHPLHSDRFGNSSQADFVMP